MVDAWSIVEKWFDYRGKELVVGGIPISEVVNQYSSPLFIYDYSVIERKLRLLRRALPDSMKIYYSVKANPNQAIIKFFVSQGCGLEVASGGEFCRALEAGCSAGRILFAGPGKTGPELELALRRGIGEIHVESFQEIDRIVQIATTLGIQANIAIRVNPTAEAQGGAIRMGGQPSPFGIDEEMLDAVIDRVLTEKSLIFRGIHLFTGTQILDYKILVKQYLKAIEIAKKVATLANSPVHTVDFGGGLGIPYFSNDDELDITRYGNEVSWILAEVADLPEFAETTFIVEPGRFLVGEGGIYVTRINTIKQSRGKTYLVVDGGMNHHLAASGNLGQVIKRNFPVAILNRLDSQPEVVADIVGPLCTPLDVLARQVTVPPVQIGDMVGIFQSGAYARTASPLGFLSHPTPPELLIHGGEVCLLEPRGLYKNGQT